MIGFWCTCWWIRWNATPSINHEMGTGRGRGKQQGGSLRPNIIITKKHVQIQMHKQMQIHLQIQMHTQIQIQTQIQILDVRWKQQGSCDLHCQVRKTVQFAQSHISGNYLVSSVCSHHNTNTAVPKFCYLESFCLFYPWAKVFLVGQSLITIIALVPGLLYSVLRSSIVPVLPWFIEPLVLPMLMPNYVESLQQIGKGLARVGKAWLG